MRRRAIFLDGASNNQRVTLQTQFFYLSLSKLGRVPNVGCARRIGAPHRGRGAGRAAVGLAGQRARTEIGRCERVRRVLTNPSPNGQRNATLTSVCGKLFHAGLHDPVLLISTMYCINVARCDPPLPEGDIETIVLSVMRGHFRKISHAGHD
jgi:hypothetical protein